MQIFLNLINWSDIKTQDKVVKEDEWMNQAYKLHIWHHMCTQLKTDVDFRYCELFSRDTRTFLPNHFYVIMGIHMTIVDGNTNNFSLVEFSEIHFKFF